MTTLTVTEARSNLSKILERARNGEAIGIISGNEIVQLKPTPIIPWEESYLYQEYGVTPEEWDRFEEKQKVEFARDKDKYKIFTGDIEKDILD
jgi:antitoxin (DNA-binding transcriptional repressor) of toxin-antitoxin stability system